MQEAKSIPMARSLLLLMFISTCVTKMYTSISFLEYATLQCILACLFILSVSVYGAFRIRNRDKENKSYMERIARYGFFNSSSKAEGHI
ncbi:uncharacterized protein Eint_081310 [Encephalitozoon intestinalis ATCC 50506]|uniref:Uncharacterized protein n=1 Tax=Encephalitozoon intestinalis (strain ATCC 50506) TaxID=876142 RepID=E0S8C5_ENCIT|nr:uncharacterized protein Eint_081310 [Encephalitozoon intestinalis ATCC 50506]ADM12063.1 hypothetical protein Eint_081310 [Encephalitozoon intestinalis ATCC 50506]UTX45853.1 hypothetical protein GPK93_08g14320 [Encephalitozoon intestinalis]